ncbi:50S ribosomal protein L11 methyltransferase [Arenimonas sp.]|uniref:50S ribosomal protein L11 methyltransferase n=1 Tax=Arenimonas sp. TaxID=1872635 RepID=UPI002E2FA73F|nr:50S ribosomal protein L11 methyltransferase [Arenimonas sp.]HEX4853090.1 50S ribosomal protein L11 methyltransferase [Arenimonas sp.]
MPFLELSLRVRAEDEHRAENALMDLGALSVTLMDADAATPNEKAVLEPGVGETPLWPEITLLALFPGDTVAELVLHALESFDDAIDLSQADFREVADQDWERAWMDQYVPLSFGTRTWIVPWNMDPPPEARDGVIVRLDPGLAFGSGTHPTTSLCLQWLDSLVLRDKVVLDFGCGSGILALAALKLGAKAAVGVDNDPQALAATADNAERNGVGDLLTVYSPEDEPAATYPVVVANILASALDALAETLACRVAPGGVIALSGILQGQEDALLARYAEWFDDLVAVREGDWMRITGVRKAGVSG